MKTTNSTLWCNLFSTASKYNICINKSRYRNLVLLSNCVFLSLLLIVYLTYAYQLVLTMAVLTITLLSVLIVKRNQKPLTSCQMILDEKGVCSFENSANNTLNEVVDSKEQFQLLSSSRYSFFGCWLHMTPLANHTSSLYLSNGINKSDKKRCLFIYRDSLTAEGFSRLSHVIRTLAQSS